MADRKISELTNITGANLANADEFVVVDTSADETKAITFDELKNALDTGTGFVRITGDNMTGDLNVSGNVGVGLTSPAQKLDVAGNIRSKGTSTEDRYVEVGAARSGNGNSYIDLVGDTTYTDYGFRMIRSNGGENGSSQLMHRGLGQLVIKAQEAAPITFYTTNAERMRITSGGNVGIGATPNNTLTIKGGAHQFDIETSASGVTLESIDRAALSDASDIGYYARHGTHQFFTSSYTERMRITNGGQVGIGNTIPSAFYTGADDLVVGSSGGSHGITVYTGTSNSGALYFADGTTGLDEYRGGIFYTHNATDANESLGLVAGGVTKMRIRTTGYAELASASQIRLTLGNAGTAGTNNANWIRGTGNALGLNAASDNIHFEIGGSEKMRISSTSVGIGASSPSGVFHVSAGSNKNVRVRPLTLDNFTNEGVGFTFSRTTSDSDLMALGVAEGDKLGMFSRSGIIFATGATTGYSETIERMRILNNGRVGIGTSAPANKLHVTAGSVGNTNGDAITHAEISGGRHHLDFREIRTADTSDWPNTTYQLGMRVDTTRHQSIDFVSDGSGNEHIDIKTGNQQFHSRFTYNGRLGIGTTTPARQLTVSNSGAALLLLESTGDDNGQLLFGDSADGTVGKVGYAHSTNHMFFNTNGSERMRIDSSGNVGIGETSPAAQLHVKNSSGNSVAIVGQYGTGTRAQISAFSNQVEFKAYNGTNDVMTFVTGSTERWRINESGHLIAGSGSSNEVFYKGDIIHRRYGASDTDGSGIHFTNDATMPVDYSGAFANGSEDLGIGSYKWRTVYATNGSINTSDITKKQQINQLTATEMLVAKRISALFKTYKWNDSVEEKGDNARIHTGVMAQQLQQAFTDEGLDATKYAMFCSDTVYEVIDEDGNVSEFYTNINDVPEGVTTTERTEYALRYSELFAFICAYNDQRFTDLETRLDALEA